MKCQKRKTIFLTLLAGMVCFSGKTMARENVVNGGLSIGQEYNSNVFNIEDDRIEEWLTVVSPSLSFMSGGQSDSFGLTYTPQFSHNHRRDENEFIHNLGLSAEKAVSSRWQLSFDESYSYFDNPILRRRRPFPSSSNFYGLIRPVRLKLFGCYFLKLSGIPRSRPFMFYLFWTGV